MARTRIARSGRVGVAYELRGRFLRAHRPWLLLVNGLGFDRHGWAPVAEALGRRFRLVVFDHRSTGSSDEARRPCTVGTLAGDAAAVLDAARIASAHVLGVSLGGMVAQELAIDRPERVRRLVLASTTPGWPHGYPFPAGNALLLWERVGLPETVSRRRRVEHALSAATLRRRPGLVGRIVAHQEDHPPRAAGARLLAAAGAGYGNRGRDTLVSAPTLVIHGEADPVVDPRNADVLAERIPGARLVVMPGRGHLLWWEDPDGFADLVAGFLGEGDRGGAAAARWRRVRALVLRSGWARRTGAPWAAARRRGRRRSAAAGAAWARAGRPRRGSAPGCG